MIAGTTLAELAQEAERRKSVKADFRAPNSVLRMTAEEDEDGTRLVFNLETPNELKRFEPNARFHQQFANKLGIPKVYYDRMTRETPELLIQNCNTWLKREPEAKHTIRALATTARAFLGANFPVHMDNDVMLDAALPDLLTANDLTIQSMQMTEENVYLQCVLPNITTELRTTVRGAQVNDVVQAGFIVSNNEVGGGTALVEDLVFRLSCTNGMVMSQVMRRRHVGRHISRDDAHQVEYSNEALIADRTAFQLKVRDSIRGAITGARFEQNVARLQAAAESDPIKKPEPAVEITCKQLGLNESERPSILQLLCEGGDYTKWGLANAVTAVANNVEDYDRAVELERIGCAVIDLPKRDWTAISEAA